MRDSEVRQYFDQIVWIPLGQTPVIDKLQNLALKQLNGQMMPNDASQDEKRELLRRAMVGKRILLALDDLWTAEHEDYFNFIDPESQSRIMISTRVRGILTDAAAGEVGVPSEEEAINILMAAADMTDSPIPTAASEICRICGRLPLALGMAGKLIKALELDGDWTDVSAILMDELSEGMSSEQRVIRASLAGLNCSSKDKEGVTNLFKLFGLVPEDTVCPLSCLCVMYDAVYAKPVLRGRKATATPILNIR